LFRLVFKEETWTARQERAEQRWETDVCLQTNSPISALQILVLEALAIHRWRKLSRVRQSGTRDTSLGLLGLTPESRNQDAFLNEHCYR
jgi:hypothetical protein